MLRSSLSKYLLKRRKKRFILCYHRVSELENDPWELAVTQKQFNEHLSFLNSCFQAQSLQELVSHSRGKLAQTSFAVTFDDGYLDNYTKALPIIEKHKVPTTFFICTSSLEGKAFWWDELTELIFSTSDLITGNIYLADIEEQLGSRLVLSGDPISRISRSDLYHLIWGELYPQSLEKKQSVLRYLHSLTSKKINLKENNRTMSIEDLVSLNNSIHVSIGSHGLTHQPLPHLSKEESVHEISASKNIIENALQFEVKYFSYPHGDSNQYIAECVRESGYEIAVTTQAKSVEGSDCSYHIPRITVGKWDVKELVECLEQHNII